jgi:hypothetical protein
MDYLQELSGPGSLEVSYRHIALMGRRLQQRLDALFTLAEQQNKWTAKSR